MTATLETNIADGDEKAEWREPCAFDYTPCSCYVSKENATYNFTYVTCPDVSVANVQDVFMRTNDSEIYELTYNVPYSDIISLPADFLGSVNVKSILIHQNYINPNISYAKLTVNSLAFRSTKGYTTDFSFKYWDLRLQIDFNFLTGFTALSSLYLYELSNLIALQYLPPLPSLESLSFIRCPNLNETVFPDISQSNKLKFLRFDQNYMGDRLIDAILTSLAGSMAANSLESFWSTSELLTYVPKQFSFSSVFPKLNDLTLDTNRITELSSSSLSFSSPLTYVSLIRNSIKPIASGTFQGNFTKAVVDFAYNYLTLFEESVFKEMLQQMVSVEPRVGYVRLASSKFSPNK